MAFLFVRTFLGESHGPPRPKGNLRIIQLSLFKNQKIEAQRGEVTGVKVTQQCVVDLAKEWCFVKQHSSAPSNLSACLLSWWWFKRLLLWDEENEPHCEPNKHTGSVYYQNRSQKYCHLLTWSLVKYLFLVIKQDQGIFGLKTIGIIVLKFYFNGNFRCT